MHNINQHTNSMATLSHFKPPEQIQFEEFLAMMVKTAPKDSDSELRAAFKVRLFGLAGLRTATRA